MEQVKYTVGIDPGSTTGLAVYNHEKEQITKIMTLDFWSCYQTLAAAKNKAEWYIVIEAPNKTAMYGRQSKIAGEKSASYGNRMMSNAASNAREAELLADGLEKLGFQIKRVRPKRRNHKTAAEDVAHVQALTGYMERTNAHTRDAICLAWNKS